MRFKRQTNQPNIDIKSNHKNHGIPSKTCLPYFFSFEHFWIDNAKSPTIIVKLVKLVYKRWKTLSHIRLNPKLGCRSWGHQTAYQKNGERLMAFLHFTRHEGAAAKSPKA